MKKFFKRKEQEDMVEQMSLLCYSKLNSSSYFWKRR